LNLLFFLFFCVFFNPQSLVAYISAFLFNKDDPKKEDFIISTLHLYLQPLVILTFNAGIIPLLVDLVANCERHKTKSKRQVSIMKKNFFFQIMNTIFVPLTVNTSISYLFNKLNQEGISYDVIRGLLIGNFASEIFITISIQLTFISNGI
jgi:Calcium-dependent channel, 7TM region, putative phosphate